ncbi:TraR/DksA family transcriptional regulator [Primorskyibacter sedentarius]|uniref:TraR/DksA family transcriptional regulator n=1 Tax=Primorskyibacter sedentarius TaxID=745311 RepID=A0A4R3JLI3_9RHOB|nr:TraR/DksA family transcriptional regulator [Primorskyibacter sedentarius]TCS67207.1 TraR/DksA family transcriptional regulator [Primorskyibacter sedentarius]
MATLEDRRKALLGRMGELGIRMDAIEDALDAPHSRDWEELATEREDDEVLEGLGAAGQAEVARIRAALRRIEKGEYGICVECGEKIAEERLDLVPDTPLCRTCAARAADR